MRKTLFDIPIDWVTEEELWQTVRQFFLEKSAHQITTVNPEFIVLAQFNPEFKQILQQSDLSLADGTGIVLAQTYLDSPAPQSKLAGWTRFISLGFKHLFSPQFFVYKRITGVELTAQLLQMSHQERLKVFLLGAAPGVAQRAAEIWSNKYPGVQFVGTSSANPDDPDILNQLTQAQPDILLVAYGAPKQELFIANRANALNIPVMVGVGGTFDYAAGRLSRGPAFLRAIGLEWLLRLIQQPRRIKRIYRSTILFIHLCIKAAKQ